MCVCVCISLFLLLLVSKQLWREQIIVTIFSVPHKHTHVPPCQLAQEYNKPLGPHSFPHSLLPHHTQEDVVGVVVQDLIFRFSFFD